MKLRDRIELAAVMAIGIALGVVSCTTTNTPTIPPAVWTAITNAIPQQPSTPVVTPPSVTPAASNVAPPVVAPPAVVTPPAASTGATVPVVAQPWGGVYVKAPLWIANDSDRQAGVALRQRTADALQAAGATVCPMLVCYDNGDRSKACSPYGNLDYEAWLYYTDNDKAMFGAICDQKGMKIVPILYCSDDPSSALADDPNALSMLQMMKPFWTVHSHVETICIAVDADKFMLPATVDKIAGYIRATMPGVRVIVHCQGTAFDGCTVDAISHDAIER